jgi:hypothetical protein
LRIVYLHKVNTGNMGHLQASFPLFEEAKRLRVASTYPTHRNEGMQLRDKAKLELQMFG